MNAQSSEEVINAVQHASSTKDYKNKHIADAGIVVTLDEIEGAGVHDVLFVNQLSYLLYFLCVVHCSGMSGKSVRKC